MKEMRAAHRPSGPRADKHPQPLPAYIGPEYATFRETTNDWIINPPEKSSTVCLEILSVR